jgi:hypothetical protein
LQKSSQNNFYSHDKENSSASAQGKARTQKKFQGTATSMEDAIKIFRGSISLTGIVYSPLGYV